MDEGRRKTEKSKVSELRAEEQEATEALHALIREAPKRQLEDGSQEVLFTIEELKTRLNKVLDVRVDYHKAVKEHAMVTWRLLKQKRVVKSVNRNLRPAHLMRISLVDEMTDAEEKIRNELITSLLVGFVFSLVEKVGDTESFREVMRLAAPRLDMLIESQKREQKMNAEISKKYSKSRTLTS